MSRGAGTKSIYLLGIISLLLLQGCDGKPEVSKEMNPPKPASYEITLPAGNNEVRGGEKVYVAISPKRPTVKDDLRALPAGTNVVRSLQWQRNGSVISTADTDTLSPENFLRGDEITVFIETDLGEARDSVLIANALPQILSAPFQDSRLRQGTDIVVKPEAVDADGDSVSFRFSWVLNGEPVPMNDSPVLPGDLFRKGDRISLEISPFDGAEEGYPFVGLDFVIPNAPPQFTSSPPMTFLGSVYSYEAQASDPDDDDLRYSLETAPPGMMIDPETGKLSWQIGEKDAGDHQIRIIAEDEDGMRAQQEYSLRIAIKAEADEK